MNLSNTNDEREILDEPIKALKKFGEKTICFNPNDASPLFIISDNYGIDIILGSYYFMSYYDDCSEFFYLRSEDTENSFAFWQVDKNLERCRIEIHNAKINFYRVIKNDKVITSTKKNIYCYDINDSKPLWEIDINDGIVYKEKNYQTNEMEVKTNEFYGGNEWLFVYKNILYASTKAGLLAYNIENGKLLWSLLQGNGIYQIYNDKLYMINYKGIVVCEPETGMGLLINPNIQVKEGDKTSVFASNFKVFSDYLLGWDTTWGKIAFFNRSTLALEKVVPVAGLALSRDNVIWHQNRLYILGIGDILRIYE